MVAALFASVLASPLRPPAQEHLIEARLHGRGLQEAPESDLSASNKMSASEARTKRNIACTAACATAYASHQAVPGVCDPYPKMNLSTGCVVEDTTTQLSNTPPQTTAAPLTS